MGGVDKLSEEQLERAMARVAIHVAFSEMGFRPPTGMLYEDLWNPRTIKVQPGGQLILKGVDPDRIFYILIAGSLKIHDREEDAPDLERFKIGTLIGLSAVLSKDPHSCNRNASVSGGDKGALVLRVYADFFSAENRKALIDYAEGVAATHRAQDWEQGMLSK